MVVLVSTLASGRTLSSKPYTCVHSLYTHPLIPVVLTCSHFLMFITIVLLVSKNYFVYIRLFFRQQGTGDQGMWHKRKIPDGPISTGQL